VAHSLLAASAISDCVSHEMCRRGATHRHGAQVNDVPVMFWSILRCGVARKKVCGRRPL